MNTEPIVVPAIPEGYEFPETETVTVPVVEYNDATVPGTPTLYTETTTQSAGGFFHTSSLQDIGLIDLVQMLVVYSFIIAGALSAVFIFMGGISFILSGGNDEKIKQAINTIRYAIIGLIITILSFTFVTIVGRMFGLDFMEYLKYGQVVNSINKLISGPETTTQGFEIRR